MLKDKVTIAGGGGGGRYSEIGQIVCFAHISIYSTKVFFPKCTKSVTLYKLKTNFHIIWGAR
jgi:hypothetical protein